MHINYFIVFRVTDKTRENLPLACTKLQVPQTLNSNLNPRFPIYNSHHYYMGFLPIVYTRSLLHELQRQALIKVKTFVTKLTSASTLNDESSTTLARLLGANTFQGRKS
ncbi:unnamed protein product [Clavelina lepadiformis]|uniref:Uncharacterized protein n=1 Tax=Clavelina lepadiformis TaxID=159417 RepID=A0ABP0FVB5_CLALP